MRDESYCPPGIERAPVCAVAPCHPVCQFLRSERGTQPPFRARYFQKDHPLMDVRLVAALAAARGEAYRVPA